MLKKDNFKIGKFHILVTRKKRKLLKLTQRDKKRNRTGKETTRKYPCKPQRFRRWETCKINHNTCPKLYLHKDTRPLPKYTHTQTYICILYINPHRQAGMHYGFEEQNRKVPCVFLSPAKES